MVSTAPPNKTSSQYGYRVLRLEGCSPRQRVRFGQCPPVRNAEYVSAQPSARLKIEVLHWSWGGSGCSLSTLFTAWKFRKLPATSMMLDFIFCGCWHSFSFEA